MSTTVFGDQSWTGTGDTTITGPGQQHMPAVAELAGGGYVVAWVVAPATSGDASQVHAQRFDASGAAVGPELVLNSAPAYGTPSVVAQPDGGFVATWNSSPDTAPTDYIARRFDASGTPLTPELRANDVTNADPSAKPLVTTALPNGGFVMQWWADSGAPNYWGPVLQMFDAAGNKVGGNVTLAAQIESVTTAATPYGGYDAIWTAPVQGTGTPTVVHLQRFDSAGHATGAEADEPSYAASVEATTLVNGNIVLTSERIVPNTGLTGLDIQFFAPDGHALSALIPVAGVSGNLREHQVTALADGGFLLSWMGWQSTGASVMAQHFDAFGASASPAFQVGTVTGDAPRYSVSATADGGAVFGWDSTSADPGDVHVQRFVPPQPAPGQWVSTGPVQIDGPDVETSPSVAVLADGSSMVGWMELQQPPSVDNTSYNAVAQHYDAAGRKIGGEVQLNDQPIQWGTLNLEPTANGGFVALWNDGTREQRTWSGPVPIGTTPPTTSRTERIFDADGHALSPETTLSPAVQQYGDVTPVRAEHLAGGGTVVAWHKGFEPGTDSYKFQVLDANGAAVGGVQTFGHAPDGSAVSSTDMYIAPEPGGGFVAVYGITGSGGPGTGATYFQRYDASGGAVGNLTAAPTNDVQAAAVLATGGILVAQFPGDQQIKLTRFDLAGQVASERTYALPDGGHTDTNPAGVAHNRGTLTALPDGGWLFSWEQTSNSRTQLYGERFDAQGNPVGGPEHIAVFGNGFMAYDVKLTPDGGVEYLWGNFNTSGPGGYGSDYLDAYMEHFAPAGAGPAGTPGNVITGTATGEALTGGPGNDRLAGMGGSDTLDGGAGTDTAVIPGSVADVRSYSIGHGQASVTTASGTDTLVNIERVQFGDALFALDTHPGEHTWQAAALFHAGFGVLPGVADLGHWTAVADQSASMGVLAQHMIDAYAPGVSSQDLVAYLYQQLTHQAATTDVVQGYVDQIGPGKTYATQGEALAYAANLSLNTDGIAAIVGTVQQLDAGAF